MAEMKTFYNDKGQLVADFFDIQEANARQTALQGLCFHQYGPGAIAGIYPAISMIWVWGIIGAFCGALYCVLWPFLKTITWITDKIVPKDVQEMARWTMACNRAESRNESMPDMPDAVPRVLGRMARLPLLVSEDLNDLP